MVADPVQIALDSVALIAVTMFTVLSATLARSLSGSGLKRGFFLASIAGIVHLTANSFTLMGDLGLVDSNAPILAFSLVQALFMVLLALAVRSFFPVWYKGFKNRSDTPPPPGLSR